MIFPKSPELESAGSRLLMQVICLRSGPGPRGWQQFVLQSCRLWLWSRSLWIDLFVHKQNTIFFLVLKWALRIMCCSPLFSWVHWWGIHESEAIGFVLKVHSMHQNMSECFCSQKYSTWSLSAWEVRFFIFSSLSVVFMWLLVACFLGQNCKILTKIMGPLKCCSRSVWTSVIFCSVVDRCTLSPVSMWVTVSRGQVIWMGQTRGNGFQNSYVM